MRRIPFPTESYQHPSKPLSAKRLLNVMAESAPSDARSEVVLVPTPGLIDQFGSPVGAGPILAMNTDAPGIAYFVSGTHAYRSYFSVGLGHNVVEDIGDVGTVSSVGPFDSNWLMVTIAVSNNMVVVCVPPNAFMAAHTPVTPLNLIGGTFPGANSVCFFDSYFVFTQVAYGTEFFISAISDPATFDALDFANIEGQQNNILRAIEHNGELWLIGYEGHEIWYDSGNADFPFRRRQTGGVVRYGTATPKSIGQIDGSVWWLGTDGIVYRSQGYQALRISTHAIEAIIDSFGPGSTITAIGMCYIDAGHSFYVLTLGGGSRTLVYDANTKVWHDRASAADGTGAWRASCAASLTDYTLIGDNASGTVWRLDTTVATDAGLPLMRQATFPPIYANTRRGFCSRFELEMEVGAAGGAGDVTLDWSDDGGNTFTGGPRALSSGTAGMLRQRVYSTRLGSFRERVFRVTARERVTLYAADADVTAGNS
jgi:hypothetical protein